MDPLDDLPPESRRDLVSVVVRVLDVSADDAEAIIRASQHLWDTMEDVGGLVDSWGGGEFCHLFPRMLTAIGSGVR